MSRQCHSAPPSQRRSTKFLDPNLLNKQFPRLRLRVSGVSEFKMRKSQPPLLPAPSADENKVRTTVASTGDIIPKKRRQSRVACDACRVKKAKVSLAQPPSCVSIYQATV
jgi:hypothetical protein